MKNDGFKEKVSSSEFLQQRIRLNQNSTNNFEHWSINTMPKIPLASNILDLGCGTGKQIESFSRLLPKTCKYIGCDISQESLNVIKESYASSPTLELIHDSFDNISLFLNKNIEFDLIYSFYALYYTQDLQMLIKNIYTHLKKNGVFWVVMPYKNTNVEIFTILNKIYPIDERVIYSINGFAQDVISIASETNFQDIEISLFENKINFTTERDLLDYIENTTFYDKNFAKEITEEIQNHFKNDFSLTKEVISIKLTK